MITNSALTGNLPCVADTLNRRIGLHQWSRRYVLRRRGNQITINKHRTTLYVSNKVAELLRMSVTELPR